MARVAEACPGETCAAVSARAESFLVAIAAAWTPLLENVSGYADDDLSACVAEMHAVFRKAESNSLQAVREKYSHAKFLCVSTLTPPDTVP